MRSAATRDRRAAAAAAEWTAAAAAALLLGGCAVLPREAGLHYAVSRSVERRPRQTPLKVVAFIDRAADARRLGRAKAAFGLWTVPLKASADPAEWATTAVTAELKAAGYELEAATADWKVGGLVREVSCAEGAICKVQFEGWVTMKDGWQVHKRVYSGEGMRPPLMPGEDPFELSLEEALREAAGQFRRDVELSVP